MVAPHTTVAASMPAGRRTAGAAPTEEAGARTLSELDQARLWFVFGVGLLVIQSGAFLQPMVGTRAAWVAVVLGSIVGSGILAWGARLGCRTRLTSAGLMTRVFGTAFGRLPVTLNVLQLIGWTTFELVILRSAVRALAGSSPNSFMQAWPIGALITLACGTALALLLAVPMVTLVHRVVGRLDLPLELIALAWVTWELGSQLLTHPVASIGPAPAQQGFGAALDLVIAMPVSWLPLVADYARHARQRPHAPGTTLIATWSGYTAANIWGYGIGVMVMAAALPSTDMAATMVLVPGGLIALALMTVHEFSNAYGSAYSASVSGNSLRNGHARRAWGLAIAAICTALALSLPMHSLEPFLLLLSSIFVPLFGVIFGDSLVHYADLCVRPATRINLRNTAIWIAGIALYQALEHWAPQYGSALPTLAATCMATWLTRHLAVPASKVAS